MQTMNDYYGEDYLPCRRENHALKNHLAPNEKPVNQNITGRCLSDRNCLV